MPQAISRARQFWMQSIMWLVLAAAVGAAALVDQRAVKKFQARLGLPSSFPGLELRLPQNWEDLNAADDPDALIELRDPTTHDILDVSIERISLGKYFGMNRAQRPGKSLGKISVGDVKSDLLLRPVVFGENDVGSELIVTRPLSGRHRLSIQLIIAEPPDPTARAGAIDLVKQIAASVKIISD